MNSIKLKSIKLMLQGIKILLAVIAVRFFKGIQRIEEKAKKSVQRSGKLFREFAQDVTARAKLTAAQWRKIIKIKSAPWCELSDEEKDKRMKRWLLGQFVLIKSMTNLLICSPVIYRRRSLIISTSSLKNWSVPINRAEFFSSFSNSANRPIITLSFCSISCSSS